MDRLESPMSIRTGPPILSDSQPKTGAESPWAIAMTMKANPITAADELNFAANGRGVGKLTNALGEGDGA
jgi:hypothetical protein